MDWMYSDVSLFFGLCSTPIVALVVPIPVVQHARPVPRVSEFHPDADFANVILVELFVVSAAVGDVVVSPFEIVAVVHRDAVQSFVITRSFRFGNCF